MLSRRWGQSAIRQFLRTENRSRRFSLKERILIRLHLGMCVLCRLYHRQLRVIHEALKEHPDNFTEAYQVTLSADRKARLKKLIEGGLGNSKTG